MAFLFVDPSDNALVVQGAYEHKTAISNIGGCWDGVNKVWRIVFTSANLEALLDAIPTISVSSDLEERVSKQVEKEEKLEKLRAMARQDIPVNIRIPGLKLPLYNYQRLGVMYAATNRTGLLLADEMGLGKEVPLYTPVLTQYGWKKIVNIQIGDKIYARDGNLHKVIGVYPQGVKEIVKMTFSDGVVSECGWDHLWLVKSNNDAIREKDWKVMDTKSLSESLTYGKKKPVSKWRIPLTEPINFDHADLFIPPYLLGVLIGDGDLTSGGLSFCTGDNEVPNVVSSCLPVDYQVNRLSDHGTSTCYSVVHTRNGHGSPMSKCLTNLGLRVTGEKKFIPDIYKTADINQRKELLAGLLDTDGSAMGSRTRYSTSSERLADDVIDLVRSLGGIACKSIVKGRLGNRDGYICKELDSFQLTIRTQFNPFFAPSNKAKWRLSSKLVRTIVSIEPYSKEEAVCIAVDSPDSTYILKDYVVTHNTVQGISTALFLKAYAGAKKTLIVTPASLKFNWPIEIKMFTDEKYVVIDGTPEERIAQWMRNDVFFYIVNYELLLEDFFGGRTMKARENETDAQRERRENIKSKAKRRQSMLSDIRKRIWDLMIVDECQSLKHHASKRTKNVKEMKARFRMALTGTPMDGRLEELHSLMQFVAPGLLLSKDRFFQKHVETDFWGRVTGYKRIGEVTQKIQPFFLRRLKRDVLKDLPDKVYENRIITLAPEEMKIYKELAANGHETTEDASAMVAIIRCKQFCNWNPLVDEDCTCNSKMESFKEVLEEVVMQNGHKALVFSQYKEMLNIIVPILNSMGIKYLRIDGDTPPIERASMQEKFNKDKAIDLMIGTEAMSAGLNFQSADYVINLDDNWSPAIMAQREDRCLTGNNMVFCRHSNGQYDVSRIDKIVIGDKVVTHLGREVDVSEVSSHEHRGKITAIHYTGWMEPLVCTYDHKVFIKRGDDLIWIQAHSIHPSDSMVFPKTKDKKTRHFIGEYTKKHNPCNRKLAYQDQNYIYHPVRSVNTYNDKVRVYDLSVEEEDHSFTTGFASVHNCHRNGQRNVVTVINFICKDTIEERIRGVIYAKNRITSQTLGDETDDMILKRLGPKDLAKLL